MADAAYGDLRRMIIRGTLGSGEEITETEVAGLLQCGRTPAREALARLRDRGLVIFRNSRRYTVAPITMGDVRDLFDVRLLLEVEATRRASGRANEEHLRRLDADCLATYNPENPDTISTFLHSNTDFHLTVASASGSRRLVYLLDPLLDEMERLLHLGLTSSNRGEEIVHEHRRLIDALVAGDGKAAVKEVKAQLHDAQAMVMRAITSDAHDGDLSLVVVR